MESGDKEVACRSYLIINNVAKRANIRELCLTALAHNIGVILCGHLDVEALSLDKLVDEGLEVLNFHSLGDCKEYCNKHHLTVVGIEIMENAVSILDEPSFYNNMVAFMPGNEGRGMSAAQKKICDEFVYIPQYGNGTASLNVNVATSLVLHNFTNLTMKRKEIK